MTSRTGSTNRSTAPATTSPDVDKRTRTRRRRMASIKRREDGKFRARYRDDADKEHARHFARRVDAQRWLDEQTAKLVSGTHIEPRQSRTTVAEWCDTWLAGYAGRRDSTVTQAGVHLLRIKAEFGPFRLASVRPSQVRTWCAKLASEGLAPSYVYALHARLAQLYSDALHDGWWPSRHALAAPHRLQASSALTSRRRSRSGRCTTPCPSTSAPLSSSEPSPDSDCRKRAGSGSKTSTSCVVSSHQRSSSQPSRSRPRQA